MPHFIMDNCIGCTACAKVCPQDCIFGDREELHVIHGDWCIDCSICGNVCPVSAITNHHEAVCEKVKMKDRQKAVVYRDDCTGCYYCAWVCPEDAIVMRKTDKRAEFYEIAEVVEKKCTGCGLCEEQCIKSAIVVPGYEFPSDVPTAFQLGAIADK